MEIDDDDADDNNATAAVSNEVNPAEAIAAPSVRGGLNPEAARLFRVYRTMANMLSERGYMVPKTMRELTPAQFKMKFGEHPDREALTVLVEKVDDEKNQLFVFFPTDEKVGVKPIKTFTQRMQAEGVVNAIMVLRVDITAFAKQALQEMSDNFRIEHFKESELLVDITQHTVRFATSCLGPLYMLFFPHALLPTRACHFYLRQLVPKHQVLTAAEKAELLKRYRLKETQLPRIQTNDPVARYYGMRRGTVVKIIRPSETAGRYVTYRICM
jgi:DNA-directed RNA polymerases I, II, and III subunit RPABC1